jgi:hypothetical protein
MGKQPDFNDADRLRRPRRYIMIVGLKLYFFD